MALWCREGAKGGRKGGWPGLLGLFQFMVGVVGCAHSFNDVFVVGLDSQFGVARPIELSVVSGYD